MPVSLAASIVGPPERRAHRLRIEAATRQERAQALQRPRVLGHRSAAQVTLQGGSGPLRLGARQELVVGRGGVAGAAQLLEGLSRHAVLAQLGLDQAPFQAWPLRRINALPVPTLRERGV